MYAAACSVQPKVLDRCQVLAVTPSTLDTSQALDVFSSQGVTAENLWDHLQAVVQPPPWDNATIRSTKHTHPLCAFKSHTTATDTARIRCSFASNSVCRVLRPLSSRAPYVTASQAHVATRVVHQQHARVGHTPNNQALLPAHHRSRQSRSVCWGCHTMYPQGWMGDPPHHPSINHPPGCHPVCFEPLASSCRPLPSINGLGGAHALLLTPALTATRVGTPYLGKALEAP